MSVIAIEVDGVDITDDVLIADATFTSLVNGSLGQAMFRVKDTAQTYAFNTGDSLTLDIDGVRVWGGFVMSAKKIFALSVIDSSHPGQVTRLWRVLGTDYNALFQRRIVFKSSDPTGKLMFEYSVDTYDNTIINDIFDNYLDISGDGLTRTGVTAIAKAVLDVPGHTHKGLVTNAGYTWRQSMDAIARATGGVYYISPDKVLTYVDVETATNANILTDVPDGGSDVGYQKFTIMNDGTKLVNDFLFWSAGGGSPNYVYSRVQDAASIAEHGRWQQGLLSSGIYRQTSADIVANSYVYGTPQSHRGGKDNALVFSCRVFQPLFKAGDIVDIECQVFGFAITLPLRSMTTTFASPTDPIFDLVLTHDIDEPLGLFDQIKSVTPKDLHTKIPCPPGWTKNSSGDCIPPPPVQEGGCTDCFVETAFDSFLDRTELNTLGVTSGDGRAWTTVLNSGLSDYGVSYAPLSGGFARNNGASSAGQAQFTVDPQTGDPWTTAGRFHFKIGFRPAFSVDGGRFFIELDGDACGIRWDVAPDMAAGTGTVGVDDFGNGWSASYNKTDWVFNTNYIIEGYADESFGAGIRIYVEGEAVPAWTEFAYNDGSRVGMDSSCTLMIAPFSVPSPALMYWKNLTFVSDRCSAAKFDDFSRTVSAGAGAATPSGLTWANVSTPGGSDYGVNGGMLFCGPSGGTFRIRTYPDIGPWDTVDEFTIETRMYFHQPVAYANYGFIDMELRDASGANVGWHFGVDPGGDFILNSSPSAGVTLYSPPSAWATLDYSSVPIWFRVKWVTRLSTGDVSAKIWLESEGEPTDWQVVAPPGYIHPLDPSTTRFYAELASSTAGPAEYVDFIDWDYSGKPCYGADPFCASDSDYSADGSGLTTGDMGGTWTDNTGVDPGTVVTGGQTVFSPDSTYHDWTLSGIAFDGPWTVTTQWVLPDTVTGSAPFESRSISTVSLSVSGVPDALITWSPSAPGSYAYDYTVDVGGATNGSGGGPNISIAMRWLGIGYGVDAMVTTGTVSTGWVSVSGAEPTINSIRITADLPNSLTPSVTLTSLAIEHSTAGAGGPGGCFDPVLPTPGLPSMGKISETIAHFPGDVSYQTSQAFFSGSLEVSVNGVIQTGVTTNGGADGVFALAGSPPLATTDVLFVRYMANGSSSSVVATAPAGTTVFSGDPTGVSDVSSALLSFLSGAGDLALAPGATYRCDNRMQLSSVDNAHVYAQGATIIGKGIYSGSLRDSILRFVTCDNWLIEDLYVIGEATESDVINWTSWARENEHNFMIDGSTNFTLRRCRGTNAWGDGVDIAARSSTENCDTILIDRCYFGISARNNISLTGGRNVEIRDCTLTTAGLANFDAEPNTSTDYNNHVSIVRTDVRRTNLGDTPSQADNGYALYLSAGNHEASDYFVDSCTGDRLDIYLKARSGYTNTNITITNNVSDEAAVLAVSGTTGLTFSGNMRIT